MVVRCSLLAARRSNIRVEIRRMFKEDRSLKFLLFTRLREGRRVFPSATKGLFPLSAGQVHTKRVTRALLQVSDSGKHRDCLARNIT